MGVLKGAWRGKKSPIAFPCSLVSRRSSSVPAVVLASQVFPFACVLPSPRGEVGVPPVSSWFWEEELQMCCLRVNLSLNKKRNLFRFPFARKQLHNCSNTFPLSGMCVCASKRRLKLNSLEASWFAGSWWHPLPSLEASLLLLVASV